MTRSFEGNRALLVCGVICKCMKSLPSEISKKGFRQFSLTQTVISASSKIVFTKVARLDPLLEFDSHTK